MREIEIKVRVESAEETARRVGEAGGELVKERHFEDNTLWDLPGLPLARAGRLLRVREAGGRTIVTAKGPAEGGEDSRYKVKTETETEVPDGAGLGAVLRTAGFRPAWRYQKWRREYRLPGASLVIDEIPHGTFVEIEGEPEAIDRLAALLGFDESDWIREDYRRVHERACREKGVPVGDMVFEADTTPADRGGRGRG